MAFRVATAASIEIPFLKFFDKEKPSCCICLEDYDINETEALKGLLSAKTVGNITLLNCGHGHHQPCLQKWIVTKKNTCPTCRAVISTEGQDEIFPSLSSVSVRRSRILERVLTVMTVASAIICLIPSLNSAVLDLWYNDICRKLTGSNR